MLYAFTDESHVAENYFQGAFVVTESDLDQLDQVISQTSEFAQRLGIAPRTELRGYSIMNSKDGWEPLREKFHARVAVYKFLLSRVLEVNGSLHLVNGYPTSNNNEITSNTARHVSTNHQLLEILNNFAIVSQQEISIISDEITAQGILKEEFKKQSVQLTNINSLTFVESSNNSGVQVIDALLYIYQRTRQRNIKHHRSYKVTMELWDLVSILVPNVRP
jgi:hypothetical protein